MTGFTICSLTVFFCAAPLALAPFALAEDGVVLINQNTSVNGLPGCPHAGFPVTICQSGSYRLSGNLTVPDANTDAIFINANSVTLDLNGFTIAGPVTCTQGPPVTCSGSGSGDGIDSRIGAHITVRNGNIHGMGSRGIELDGVGSLIEEIHTYSNGGLGMLVSDGLITRCMAYLNQFDGIGAGLTANVMFSNASSNGGSGIGGGALISNNLAYDNGQNGIVSSLMVIGNLALQNVAYGIKLVPGGVGYMGNQMGGNGGTVTGGTSMGQNLGNGVVF